MTENIDRKKISILLADDTQIALEGLYSIVETVEDMIIIGATTNAKEVSEMVARLSPEVLIIDLKWHGDETEGTYLINKLKISHPETIIIAMTAYEKLLIEARRGGADAALTNTFNSEELLDLVRNLVMQKGNYKILSSWSSHEIKIINLMSEYHTDRIIAEKLGVPINSLKTHVRNIISKLGVKNRREAIIRARDIDIID